ncbi:MAG: sigma 54-interacting transcriptional regulator [Pseudomonadota bacterium]
MIDSDHTLASPISTSMPSEGPALGLTILWHPQRSRIGQQCVGLQGEGTLEVQRHAPLFRHPGRDGLALEHRGVARSPVLLRRDAAGGVAITAPDSAMTVQVNGATLEGTLQLGAEDIEHGVVLALGGMVLLCVHWMRCMPRANALGGLLGVGSAAIGLRDQVRQVARTKLPVLLLGETGTGKDVAARAIHAAGERRELPFVAVNMAALNESLAAADLFGAEKGSYTGSQAARSGYFAEADGGTLFLDEIGDTPAVIQPMLLRVLESGEYRPLGARQDAHSTARLITATDQDLGKRAFNQALLRRMEAYVIRMPALRERREDIGVLVVHFLAQFAAEDGQEVALPDEFVSEVCCDDWPGNIRQLAHVLRRAAMAVRSGEVPQLANFTRVDKPSPSALAKVAEQTVVAPKARRQKLSELSYAEIAEAMERNGHQVVGAARELGISRPSLYKLLEAYPDLRRS